MVRDVLAPHGHFEQHFCVGLSIIIHVGHFKGVRFFSWRLIYAKNHFSVFISSFHIFFPFSFPFSLYICFPLFSLSPSFSSLFPFPLIFPNSYFLLKIQLYVWCEREGIKLPHPVTPHGPMYVVTWCSHLCYMNLTPIWPLALTIWWKIENNSKCFFSYKIQATVT